MTLAEQVHAAKMESQRIEGVLYDALVKIFDFEDFDDFHTDYYDNSLELSGAREELESITDGQAKAVFDLGFAQFWINFMDETEIYFAMRDGKIRRGERKKKAGAE